MAVVFPLVGWNFCDVKDKTLRVAVSLVMSGAAASRSGVRCFVLGQNPQARDGARKGTEWSVMSGHQQCGAHIGPQLSQC